MNKATLAIIAALSVSIALADDFTTTDGKEYKNVKVSRVEPDGLVITFSGGIVKIPFIELSPEIQKKYGYDAGCGYRFPKASLRRGTREGAGNRRGSNQKAATAI